MEFSIPADKPKCGAHEHARTRRGDTSSRALDRAAGIFRALGDGPRLRLLELLIDGECCVTEMVSTLGEKFSTVSQRLRLLRSEGVVRRRRSGTHLYYQLA